MAISRAQIRMAALLALMTVISALAAGTAHATRSVTGSGSDTSRFGAEQEARSAAAAACRDGRLGTLSVFSSYNANIDFWYATASGTCYTGTDQPPPGSGSPQASRQFRLQVKDTNLCVDIPDGRQVAGAKLQLWFCNELRAAQSFVSYDKAYGGDTVRVLTPATTSSSRPLCWDIPSGQFVPGTPVQLWNCNGLTAQHFNFNGGTDWNGQGGRLNSNNGMCVQADQLRAGAKLRLAPCSANVLRQQFTAPAF
jgi:hypothetical protein